MMTNMTPVLVAEDDATSRFVICSMLRKLNLDAQRAIDGVQAVDMAAALRPSIVFMDFNMPNLDEIEATRRIKADPVTANIPIIVVTADATQRTHDACLAAGCDAVIVKPISYEKIRTIIERYALT